MKDFKDKVAVITGAASGIGRGIAEHCAQEGMKVVLADIKEDLLTQTAEEMRAAGATVLAVVTDVSKASDIEALAQKSLNTFGAVHLLCNNAGVLATAAVWEYTVADWEWVLGVNLWGVIHGIRVFVPIMLDQDTDGHVVNTASMAGLHSMPYLGCYHMTKHAVVTLSESLHYEFALQATKLKASVLCPGFVRTRFLDFKHNRPSRFENDPAYTNSVPEAMVETCRQGLEVGSSPKQVAACVFDGIRDEKFYILTHPELKGLVHIRMEDILAERNPTLLPDVLQRFGIIPPQSESVHVIR